MLFFANFLYSLASASALPQRGGSVPNNLLIPSPSVLPDNQCICIPQRSFWDILWSCCATIFACSWVSVHPNMPEIEESRVKVTLRRLELMMWTIIAPELIVTWAIRQWMGARYLSEQYKEYGWTKTHGHFLQMGGFMLYSSDKQTRKEVLSPERLQALHEEGRIDIPTVSENEIKDRSKADALNKTLVFGQTAWFVVQCVARSIQGLIVTELELVTVAFAFLHAFMYFLWLEKPLGAQYPVPVFEHDPPDALALQNEKRVVYTNKEAGCATETELPSLSPLQRLKNHLRNIFKSISSDILQLLNHFIGTTKPLFDWSPLETLKNIFIYAPLQTFKLFVSRLDAMVESDKFDSGRTRVPTFYAMEAKEKENTPLGITSFIAVAFGAIHCAGWSFTFPSSIDAFLWRGSSAAITIIPFCAILVGVLFSVYLQITGIPVIRWVVGHLLLAVGGFTVISLPFYIVARFIILAEAIAGMRFLRPGAIGVVNWTTFVPHI